MNATKLFTVVLRYPDYEIDNWVSGHVVQLVTAGNARTAASRARSDVCKLNDNIKDPDDMLVIAVFAGHHDNLHSCR